MSTPITDDDAFVEAWNALDRPERKRLRRLVRLGRPIDEPKLAGIAPSYARYQRARAWVRYFWLWFVPGLFVALTIAGRAHPVFVGIVLALAVQAVLTNHHLRRAARSAPA